MFFLEVPIRSHGTTPFTNSQKQFKDNWVIGLKLPSTVHQTEVLVDIRDRDLRVRSVQLQGEVRRILADRDVDRRAVCREMRPADLENLGEERHRDFHKLIETQRVEVA